MNNIKKLIPLPILMLLALTPINSQKEYACAKAFANEDFEVVRIAGDNPWTINEDSFVSTNNRWDSNFLICKTADTSLNIENRPEYTITTSFTGPAVSAIEEDQWRGIVIYYVDNQNFLEAVCKWSKNDRSYELQELMLHGQINGEFYQTGSEGNWSSTEWHDIWTDGCGIASDETVTLTASIYPKDSTHDEVSLSAVGSGGGVAGGKQTIRSIISYADNYLPEGPKVGLYSHLGDGKTGSVTFHSFEFRNDVNIGKTPHIEESGTRSIYGYTHESVKLPTFTVTNEKFDILSCDISVTDPNDIPVSIKKNAFVPEIKGIYNVNVTCVDARYNEFAEPIHYQIKVYDKVDIVIKQSFSVPAYGVKDKKLYLPKFTANVDTHMLMTVYDADGETIIPYEGDYIVPSKKGIYQINITSSNTFFGIEDINYEIQIYDYDPIENPNNSNLPLMIIITSLLSLATTWTIISVFWLLKRRGI